MALLFSLLLLIVSGSLVYSDYSDWKESGKITWVPLTVKSIGMLIISLGILLAVLIG